MARKKTEEPEVEVISESRNSWRSWRKRKRSSKPTIIKKESNGSLYILGFIGSLIYWFQAATTFGAYITAILKSLVWPAYIVYKFLESFYGIV